MNSRMNIAKDHERTTSRNFYCIGKVTSHSPGIQIVEAVVSDAVHLNILLPPIVKFCKELNAYYDRHSHVFPHSTELLCMEIHNWTTNLL